MSHRTCSTRRLPRFNASALVQCFTCVWPRQASFKCWLLTGWGGEHPKQNKFVQGAESSVHRGFGERGWCGDGRQVTCAKAAVKTRGCRCSGQLQERLPRALLGISTKTRPHQEGFTGQACKWHRSLLPTFHWLSLSSARGLGHVAGRGCPAPPPHTSQAHHRLLSISSAGPPSPAALPHPLPRPGPPWPTSGLRESPTWPPLPAVIRFPQRSQKCSSEECPSGHWCICFPAHSLSDCIEA